MDTCKATFEVLRRADTALCRRGEQQPGSQHPPPAQGCSRADVGAAPPSRRPRGLQRRGQTRRCHHGRRGSTAVLLLTRQILQPSSVHPSQRISGNPSTCRPAQSAAHPQALNIYIRANCFTSETHPPWARGGRQPPGAACSYAYKHAEVIR